jgi:hypothetical protein
LTQGEGTLKLVNLILQQTSGEVDPAFDGTEGLFEHHRDLMVFVSFEVEEEWLLENAGQFVDRLLDIFHPHGCFSSVGDSRLVMVEQKFIGTIVKYGVLLGFAAVVVDENIAHDGVEPSFDVGSYTVLLFVGEGPEHGFLDQVLGRLMILGQCNCKGSEVFCITEQQLVEFLSRHTFLFKLVEIKFKQNSETANYFCLFF